MVPFPVYFHPRFSNDFVPVQLYHRRFGESVVVLAVPLLARLALRAGDCPTPDGHRLVSCCLGVEGPSRSARKTYGPADHEVHDLIRRMSRGNPAWGAPRIHSEMVKLSHSPSRRPASANTCCALASRPRGSPSPLDRIGRQHRLEKPPIVALETYCRRILRLGSRNMGIGWCGLSCGEMPTALA
jgi:hypothetical protein